MCESQVVCGIAHNLTRNRTTEFAKKNEVFPQTLYVKFCKNFLYLPANLFFTRFIITVVHIKESKMKVDFNPSYISYKAAPKAVSNGGLLPRWGKLWAVKELGNNIRFGFRSIPIESGYTEHCAPYLKKDGIKHIILIPDDKVIEQMAKKDGFDTLSLAFNSDEYNGMLLARPPFEDKIRWEHKRYPFKKCDDKSYDELSREFVDKFTKFINCLQDGNCYIEGGYEPDIESVFILNKFFNPQADKIEPPLGLPVFLLEYMAVKMLNLYKALTKEDKAKMNWPKDFDTTFLQNIKKAENDRINWEVQQHFHQLNRQSAQD